MVKLLLVMISSVCMLLISTFALVQAVQNGSLVTQLPGFDGVFPSKHYSGYVTIEEKKNLFYYFVVSERNPSSDPVVLWLNGGPGCSSFDGFVYEHGPFNFYEGKPKGSLPTLKINPYSWSKVSNIIYLDSPVGVGLSYSINTSTYNTGDLQTAADTHAFLLEWFDLYPEFVSNPFYISGESYAGIYVPTLASEVVKGIKAGAKPAINFKGYMVGNGLTDYLFDGDNALVPFTHGMALISNDIFKECEVACGGNYSDPSAPCQQNIDKVYIAVEGVNVYDILEPCYEDPSSQLAVQGNKTMMNARSWPFRAPVKDGIVPSFPQQDGNRIHVPCTNDEVATLWLNDPAVREAIHAEPENVAGPWYLCTRRISLFHDAGSMIPYHKNLTSQGYRALIYSGDHDMRVPFTGSQAWVKSLGYNTTIEWRSWHSHGQVAGYLQGYDHDLTFLTIKGAGHMVPQYKPRESLDFYSRWLDQTPI